ncbi:MAG: acylphosphatase [Monoraphidium minutum]|nr:MAG: acylphosphatase [Monoraphidium minutum]
MGSLGAFKFEVHGRVQGVFFRVHTITQAQKLQLVGWCANSARRTVVGEVQGTKDGLERMKHWLGHIGSPASTITKLDVSEERDLGALEYQDMQRRPNVP